MLTSRKLFKKNSTKLNKIALKAISVLIATILLIAFTVGIGAVISVWFGTLTKTTTGATEASTANVTKCAVIGLRVDLATTSKLVYSNPSAQTISDVQIVGSDGTLITPSVAGATLTAGEVASENVTRGLNASFTVKGLCLASVPVEAKCSSGAACWIT